MTAETSAAILSTRPYLLQAFYDWICDNGWTPYMVVNSFMPQVSVPQDYVDGEGKIVLSISQGTVKDLVITKQHVTFVAKFSGLPVDIFAPIMAIEAIYARENGRGIVFSDDDGDLPPGDLSAGKQTSDKTPDDKPKHKKSHLKLVK